MNRFAKKFVQSTVISGLALSLFSASAIAADEKDFLVRWAFGDRGAWVFGDGSVVGAGHSGYAFGWAHFFGQFDVQAIV